MTKRDPRSAAERLEHCLPLFCTMAVKRKFRLRVRALLIEAADAVTKDEYEDQCHNPKCSLCSEHRNRIRAAALSVLKRKGKR